MKSRLFSQDENSENNDTKGFLGNALDYEKALGLGLAQGAGDVGASIGNFPASIYEHFTGRQPYHIPHPALQQYYPEGTAGGLGSKIGETIGSLAAPGGITFKALKAFNNPLAKALMGGAAGGLSGAASNENNRTGSALIGAALGGTIPLSQTILKGLGNSVPLTKGIASTPYAEKAKYMQEHGLGSHLYVNPEYLNEAERLMKNHTLDIPQEAIEEIIPLAKAGEHDAIHAVQSTLKSLGRDLSKKGGVPGRLGEKYHSLAEKIMGDVNEQMKIMGHKKAVQLEEQGKKRYARYYKQAPLRKLVVKTGAGALGLGSGYEALKHILR
jgi:hypothetical protein